MLQQLAAASDGTSWAIGALLFFVVTFAVVVLLVVRRSKARDAADAMLPFDDAEKQTPPAPAQNER